MGAEANAPKHPLWNFSVTFLDSFCMEPRGCFHQSVPLEAKTVCGRFPTFAFIFNIFLVNKCRALSRYACDSENVSGGFETTSDQNS